MIVYKSNYFDIDQAKGLGIKGIKKQALEYYCANGKFYLNDRISEHEGYVCLGSLSVDDFIIENETYEGAWLTLKNLNNITVSNGSVEKDKLCRKNNFAYVCAWRHNNIDIRVANDNKDHIISKMQFSDLQDALDFYDSLPIGLRGNVEDDLWQFGKEKDSGTLFQTNELVRAGKMSIAIKGEYKKLMEEIALSGMDNLSNSIADIKRRRVFSDDGTELDIDRVMSGDPDYWAKTVRGGRQQIVRVVYNCALNCNNGAEQFVKLVAVAMAVSETLANKGYGVEIYADEGGDMVRGSELGKGRNEHGTFFPIKKAEETFDVEKVACFGLSGWFREFCFSISNGTRAYSNGRAYGTSKQYRQMLGADVYIGGEYAKGEVVAKVEKVFKELGVI